MDFEEYCESFVLKKILWNIVKSIRKTSQQNGLAVRKNRI